MSDASRIIAAIFALVMTTTPNPIATCAPYRHATLSGNRREHMEGRHES
jgi:hypothetical protein